MIRSNRPAAPEPHVRGLVRTKSGQWAEPPAPAECSRGHALGPGRMLLGNQPCGHCGSHRVIHCCECDAKIYRPEPTPSCDFQR